MPAQQQEERRRGIFAAFKPNEDEEEEPLHQPPWWVHSLARGKICLGIGANFWQIFTTFIAILSYMKISTANGALFVGAIIIGVMVAFSVQFGLLMFAFQVHKEAKKATIDGHKVRHTAVAMVHNHGLTTFWTIVAAAVATVSDFTFIGFFTSNPLIYAGYIITLYAASTLMLARGLEEEWVANIAYQKWRAFVLANDIMAEKLSRKRRAQES